MPPTTHLREGCEPHVEELNKASSKGKKLEEAAVGGACHLVLQCPNILLILYQKHVLEYLLEWHLVQNLQQEKGLIYINWV